MAATNIITRPRLREREPESARSKPRLHVWRRLLAHRAGVVGFAIVSLTVATAVFAPVLSQYDPLKTAPEARLVPPLRTSNAGTFHLLGTDAVGRDIMSRILYGSRVSLAVGALSVFLAAPFGVLVGLLASYFGGVLDRVVLVLVDIQLAVPFIIYAIAIIAVMGPSITSVIVVIGLLNWVVYARMTRSQVLVVKNHEYILAARSVGCGDLRLIARHILPNILGPLIVVATFQLAQAILLESSLTFLGAGIPPPTPTWGGMLSGGRDYLVRAWWVATFPGLALAVTVLGINFMGDWLRDVLDPTLRG